MSQVSDGGTATAAAVVRCAAARAWGADTERTTHSSISPHIQSISRNDTLLRVHTDFGPFFWHTVTTHELTVKSKGKYWVLDCGFGELSLCEHVNVLMC